jgi:hypothetical protein
MSASDPQRTLSDRLCCEMSEVDAAARMLGLEVAKFEIRRAEDIAPAFEVIKGRADALYVGPDPLMNANRVPIPRCRLAHSSQPCMDFVAMSKSEA